MNQHSVITPVGAVTLTAVDGAVVALDWGGDAASNDPVLLQAADELAEYFEGTRTGFDVPCAGYRSDFARAFADALCAIPFGETRTYGDMAKDLGVSAQAIGQACGANRIAILIPCHRVLAADGLGGYSGVGGIETKVTLLRHEGAGGLLI